MTDALARKMENVERQVQQLRNELDAFKDNRANLHAETETAAEPKNGTTDDSVVTEPAIEIHTE